MVPAPRTTSRALGGVAVAAALLGSAVLLAPAPLADAFFAGIVLLNPLFAVVGAVGAWTNRTVVVWVAAVLSVGLSLAGMMSVGLYLAPTALLLLGAAVAAQAAGPRPGLREEILSSAPSVRGRLGRAAAGLAGIAVGVALVDAGAFERELFGSCAQETLACALGTTNWPAVGLTLVGFGAVALGAWLVWKQVYVSRVLHTARAG